MKHAGILLALAATLSCLSGCTQGLETRSFQSRMIRATSPDEIFPVAQAILRREFGRIKVDPDTHRIVSEPLEGRTSSDSGTARDLYGGRSTVRRVAHFAVARRGEDAVVRLRIEIERQDTAHREIFHPDRGRISDLPGQTPIERDAATSTQQNTVWTFVKRDHRLERALLAELLERFAPAPVEPEVAEPAGERAAEIP